MCASALQRPRVVLQLETEAQDYDASEHKVAAVEYQPDRISVFERVPIRTLLVFHDGISQIC